MLLTEAACEGEMPLISGSFKENTVLHPWAAWRAASWATGDDDESSVYHGKDISTSRFNETGIKRGILLGCQ